MKTHVFLLLLTLTTGLCAQEKPKEKDPFIKDKPATVEKSEVRDVPKNVTCLLETITLSQGEYVALLDVPATREKLYESAQEAVKKGSAKLDGCHFLTNKGGARGTVEAADELIYPSEWISADSTGFQYPSAFVMRRMGDCLEMECVLPRQDGAISVTHSFSRDHFLGFHQGKADSALSGVPLPDMLEQESPSSCRALPGVPVLLSTFTGAQPGVITLVFGTFKITDFDKPAPPPSKGSGNIHLTVRAISLDRAKGCELLKKHGQDDAAALAELKTLIASQEAVLEHVSSIVNTSGSRSVHRSGPLFYYGTEFQAKGEALPTPTTADPKRTASPAQMPGLMALESRPMGFRWEIECVVNEEGTLVDHTLAISNVRLMGILKDTNLSEHYPELPVFSEQQIVTTCTQSLGSSMLLGTLNAPANTGVNERKDDNRVWLVFLDAEME